MNAAPADRRSVVLLRGLLVVGVPLALAVVLLWHPPGGDEVYEGVRDDVDAWLAVHVAFLLVLPLLGCAVLALLHGLTGRAAAVSRVALVPFLVFYTAYEATVGVATGVLVDHGVEQPAADQAVLADAVQDLNRNAVLSDPSLSLALGSLAWVVCMVAAALAFRRQGARRSVPLLLGASALFVVHPPPVGPAALVCFAVAGLLVVRAHRSPTGGPDVPQPRPVVEPPRVAPTR